MRRIDNRALFDKLLETYGLQGWWPLHGLPDETDHEGYHRGDYSLPRTGEQRFEIVTGAVLTQNTSWRNVRTALACLRESRLNSPEVLLRAPCPELRETIRSSGYFNQKSKKLREISKFFSAGCFLKLGNPPAREQLLEVWGLGEETVDSILLYAFKEHPESWIFSEIKWDLL